MSSTNGPEPVDNEFQLLEDCVICLSTISAPAKAIPCEHSNFDFLCILTWIQNRPSCPLCKADITSIQYNHRSDSEYDTYKVQTGISISDASTASLAAQGSRRFRTRTSNTVNRQLRYNRDFIRPRDETEALARRRDIYKHQLYSLHVGSNRLSAYQDLTPEKFRNDEHLVRRAKKWIRRELQLFSFLGVSSNDEEVPNSTSESREARGSSNAEFLLSYIIAILKTVDIQSAGGQAEDMLTDYLSRTDATLFLHELRAWLRSPYESLESWDSHVQYNWNSKTKHSETHGIRKADRWRPPRNQSSARPRPPRSTGRGTDQPG